MLTYLDVLANHGITAHVLDVGSWVGDIAVRWAKHAALKGYPISADCYDPSLAGTLIQANSVLNGVSDCVSYKPFGISVSGGNHVFSQFKGHSDSSRLADIGQVDFVTDNYVIETLTLKSCILLCPPNKHLIIKIDVEGIDGKIVFPNMEILRDSTLIIEFAPHQAQYKDISASGLIKKIQQSHDIYDLYYLPRPTRATLVGDADEFTAKITQRPYGYTDILAIPNTLPAKADLTAMIAGLKPIEDEYIMG